MILTEYNGKKHMKTLYAQGREAGQEEERVNTEIQRRRAEEAESRAEAAEKEVIRLREELQRKRIAIEKRNGIEVFVNIAEGRKQALVLRKTVSEFLFLHSGSKPFWRVFYKKKSRS